jgi:hypothetical protein
MDEWITWRTAHILRGRKCLMGKGHKGKKGTTLSYKYAKDLDRGGLKTHLNRTNKGRTKKPSTWWVVKFS